MPRCNLISAWDSFICHLKRGPTPGSTIHFRNHPVDFDLVWHIKSARGGLVVWTSAQTQKAHAFPRAWEEVPSAQLGQQQQHLPARPPRGLAGMDTADVSPPHPSMLKELLSVPKCSHENE